MDTEFEKMLCGKLISVVQDDREFAARLLDVEDTRTLIQIVGEKGVELGQEEASELLNALSNAKNTGELTEEELQNVSGGFAITLSAFGIWCIVAAGAAALTYGVYRGSKEEAAKSTKKSCGKRG